MWNRRTRRCHPLLRYAEQRRKLTDDVVDGAGGVERLQHDKQGLVAVRVKQVLQLVHAFDIFLDIG
jgi:hypothetical protein